MVPKVAHVAKPRFLGGEVSTSRGGFTSRMVGTTVGMLDMCDVE